MGARSMFANQGRPPDDFSDRVFRGRIFLLSLCSVVRPIFTATVAVAPCGTMGDGKEDERMQGGTKEDSDIEEEPERLQYKVRSDPCICRLVYCCTCCAPFVVQ